MINNDHQADEAKRDKMIEQLQDLRDAGRAALDESETIEKLLSESAHYDSLPEFVAYLRGRLETLRTARRELLDELTRGEHELREAIMNGTLPELSVNPDDC